MVTKDQILILCGSMQSGGSSIISWCFLQRSDMDGIFDANSDIVCTVPEGIATPYIWYKLTISSFRLSENIKCAEDEGFHVRPLLVVRDARTTWASLSHKSYGRNGTTAEDPPLRLRMRRFLEDWQIFRRNGWPIIQYENFVKSPEHTLKQTCEALAIPWDPDMISWPKPPENFTNLHHGNITFLNSKGGGLLNTLRPEVVNNINHPIPPKDLEWLELEFSEFNQVNDYPPHRDIPLDSVDRLVPGFDVTRRLKWRLRQKPLRLLLYKMGFKDAANLPGIIRNRR